MIFIDKILQWGRDNGFSALYGTPEQVNEMMTSTDFGASQDGTVMYCHLITAFSPPHWLDTLQAFL